MELTARQTQSVRISHNGDELTRDEARLLLGAPQSHKDLLSDSAREASALSMKRHSEPKRPPAVDAALDRSTTMNVANLEDLKAARRKSLSAFSFNSVGKLFSQR